MRLWRTTSLNLANRAIFTDIGGKAGIKIGQSTTGPVIGRVGFIGKLASLSRTDKLGRLIHRTPQAYRLEAG
jgi:hypothetical protein